MLSGKPVPETFFGRSAYAVQIGGYNFHGRIMQTSLRAAKCVELVYPPFDTTLRRRSKAGYGRNYNGEYDNKGYTT